MSSKKLSDIGTLSGVGSSSTRVLVKSGETLGWADRDDVVSDLIENVENLTSATEAGVTYDPETYAYGVQRTVGQSSPTLTRIGNSTYHKTLPVQSLMKGGLMDDDGNFAAFADQTDWTGYDRSGDSGQVMVEIPEHYVYFYDDGETQQAWISLVACAGFTKVPKMYISAYEATVDRTNLKLCSIVNTDEQYMGGNGTDTYAADDFTFCGVPASYISLTNFRTYARNRGTAGLNDAGWNAYTYNAHKTLYWLIVIEYATLNCQLGYNSELTDEGYHQGGLGAGVTTLNGTYWNTWNAYSPFIPCGYTDSLGNQTGTVDFDMPSGYLEAASISSLTVSVPRYRGIENPFGHIWKRMDGALIYGTDNQFYTTDDPSLFSSTSYSNYTQKGAFSTNDAYVKEIMWGTYGDLVPIETGGGSTTYFCDYTYTSASDSIRCLAAGGHANYGPYAGLSFLTSSNTPSHTNANFGSRLCFFPSGS